MPDLKERVFHCPAVAELIELAGAETGLSDFGDPRLTVPLEALVASFKIDAWDKMTASAREIAVSTLTGYLAARARLADDRKRYPAIAQEKIQAPLIVVGPPRSGSTLLHTLLSLDPENNAPPHWLCLEPSPPPALGVPAPERIAKAATRQRRFFDQIPDLYIQHAYLIEDGANALGECGSDIMVMATTTKALFYYYPLGGYRDYLLRADHSGALAFHHDFLQHAQWGSEKRRWVLKAADHMLWLRELIAQYPDARLIWTHRDLKQLFSSVSSVFTTCRGISGPVSESAVPELARQAIAFEQETFAKAMHARDAIGEASFFDLSYHDMMADPLRAVHQVYERFGFTLSPAAQKNIRDWVAQNPQTKHGVHRHIPDRFELQEDGINAQFAEYRERFGFGYGIVPAASAGGMRP